MSNAKLVIEALPGEMLNLKVNRPADCARMIRTAMESRADIGAMFIAAVVDYAIDKDLSWADLKNATQAYKHKR